LRIEIEQHLRYFDVCIKINALRFFGIDLQGKLKKLKYDFF